MAHTDCARWLNGRGRGARWDNTLTSVDTYVLPSCQSLYRNQDEDADDRLEFPGKCSDKTGPSAKGFSSDYKEFLAKSFETQTYVYEQAVRLSTLLLLFKVRRESEERLINSLDGSCGLGKLKKRLNGQ